MAAQPPAAQPVAYFASREYGGKVLWEQMNESYKHYPEVVPLYRQPDPRIAEYRSLLRDALGALAGDFEINPRDVRDRIAAALKEG